MIVIPHPVPPGVRALCGPGVRAPQPPGDDPGESRKCEEEASREGRCGGGIEILPISGRDEELLALDAKGGESGETGVIGIVLADPVDPEPTFKGTAGLAGILFVGATPIGLRSGSIGFQTSFNAALVTGAASTDTSARLRTAFSSTAPIGSSNTVVPGGNAGFAFVTLASLALLVGGACGIAEFASELRRPPFPVVGLFGDAALAGDPCTESENRRFAGLLGDVGSSCFELRLRIDRDVSLLFSTPILLPACDPDPAVSSGVISSASRSTDGFLRAAAAGLSCWSTDDRRRCFENRKDMTRC